MLERQPVLNQCIQTTCVPLSGKWHAKRSVIVSPSRSKKRRRAAPSPASPPSWTGRRARAVGDDDDDGAVVGLWAIFRMPGESEGTGLRGRARAGRGILK